MKKHAVPMFLSAGLLITATASRALLEWPPFVAHFPYLMWVHVAIIGLAFYGLWVARKLAPARDFATLGRRFPLWLVTLAIPVAFAVAPMLSSVTSSLGTTPDGQPVYKKSWVEEGGRHYLILNRTVRIEISDSQYTEANREMYVGFSSTWLLFSYLLLVLWHYNWRSEGEADAG